MKKKRKPPKSALSQTEPSENLYPRKMDLWRQQDIVSSAELEKVRIQVAGCGGIGSPTIFLLAKMGVQHIEVWDPDIVESHNISNQFYRIPEDLDKPKVVALREVVHAFSGVVLTIHQAKFTMDETYSDILISGVDTLPARRDIWRQIKDGPYIGYYIDGRMAAVIGAVYSLCPTDPFGKMWYEEKLAISDDQVLHEPCTRQAIMYNATMIAVLICRLVTQLINRVETEWDQKWNSPTFSLVGKRRRQIQAEYFEKKRGR